MYAKQFDQTITRSLMHTQWRVLGVGPYAELDNSHRMEVMDYMCERYFSYIDPLARYELAVHVKKLNHFLYQDLVCTGVLLTRGGELTKHDTWLAQKPLYASCVDANLISSISGHGHEFENGVPNDAVPLWFYLPSRAGNDVAWERFSENERRLLEETYCKREQEAEAIPPREAKNTTPSEQPFGPAPFRDDSTGQYMGKKNANINRSSAFSNYCDDSEAADGAIWYEPDLDEDVLVDGYRHAVSFDDETKRMIMRPILWRFLGEGNQVRRGVWVMDTGKGKGLQPYSEESASILEDAFLFLRWHLSQMSRSRVTRGDQEAVLLHDECIHDETDNESPNQGKGSSDSDPILLTVQVVGPDGVDQIVQFRSLTQVVAVSKSLVGGLSLFKKSVYRGARIHCDQQSKTQLDGAEIGIEDMPYSDLENLDSNNDEYDEASTLAAPISFSDAYTFEDEKICDHLVLVVHGIGEMMRSVDIFGLALPPLSSIVDCCGFMRENHATLFEESSELKSLSSIMPSTCGRVDYIPVEWHEKFNRLSRKSKVKTRDASLHDITLNTIPSMRALANDTLLDLMYFMSPEYHDLLIDIVTEELNTVVCKANKYGGKFFSGKVSIMAHSLGSIITWDILSHQLLPHEQDIQASSESTSSDSQSLQEARYPQLTFEVTNTFMIGAPVPVFLLIRNQHRPMNPEYCLPACPRFFNIFHPYDPVAYRIEPLINPHNTKVEPELIPNWRGGYRMQYQTKLFWKNLVNETHQRQQYLIDALEAGIRQIGLADPTDEDDDISTESEGSNRSNMVECGQLNGGRRIDYMLQESEVETANEYVFALGAHSAYWAAKDLTMFIAKEIILSEMEYGFDCRLDEEEVQTDHVVSDELISPLPAWQSI